MQQSNHKINEIVLPPNYLDNLKTESNHDELSNQGKSDQDTYNGRKLCVGKSKINWTLAITKGVLSFNIPSAHY